MKLRRVRTWGVNCAALCLLGHLGLVLPKAHAATGQLSFVAIEPCRVVDTRGAGQSGAFGAPSLLAGVERDFQLWASPNCPGIPSTVRAYSLNITAIPVNGELSFLAAWPAGTTQPLVSTLNSPAGTVVANAATVLAGTNGSIAIYTTDVTDIAIDVNGYYADLAVAVGPAGATGATGANGTNGTAGINGTTGTNGTNGIPGAAASLTVASTTTGAAGTSALVACRRVTVTSESTSYRGAYRAYDPIE